MTTRDELPHREDAASGSDLLATKIARIDPARDFVDKTEVVGAVSQERGREELEGSTVWARLTPDDALLIFLALEEYASGFSLSLSAAEIKSARSLARRVAQSAALQLNE